MNPDEVRAWAIRALLDDSDATSRSPKGSYFKSLDRARCEFPSVEDVTDVQVQSCLVDYDVPGLMLHIVTRSGRAFECLSPCDPISLLCGQGRDNG